LSAVSDEETFGPYGARYLFQHHPEVIGDSCLSGEPSSPWTLRFGEKGPLWLEFTVRTKGAHGAYTHASKSATARAAKIIGALEALEDIPAPEASNLAAALDEAAPAIDRAQGAGAARITVGYRGRTAARVTVRTHGGHASSSWAHPSAVDECLSIMSLLKEYEKENTVEGDHYRSLSASLTVIRGGSYSNVIPKRCEMTFDVRIPPGTNSSMVKKDITALVEAHARMRGGIDAKVEFDGSTEAYDAPLDSVVVRGFQRSILKSLSTRPVLTHKTGTGDMNTLADKMGIPCVTYGPADSNLGHTEMEFVDIPDYLGAIKVLSGALREIKALHRRRD